VENLYQYYGNKKKLKLKTEKLTYYISLLEEGAP